MKCEIYKYKIEDLTPSEINEPCSLYFELANILDSSSGYLFGILSIDILAFEEIVFTNEDKYFSKNKKTNKNEAILIKDMYKSKIKSSEKYSTLLTENSYSCSLISSENYSYSMEVIYELC